MRTFFQIPQSEEFYATMRIKTHLGNVSISAPNKHYRRVIESSLMWKYVEQFMLWEGGRSMDVWMTIYIYLDQRPSLAI